MIGIAVTFFIAVTVLWHGIRVGRRARAAERRDALAAIERAQTEVSFLDVVDGWFMLPESNVVLIGELHRSMQAAVAANDEGTAAARARDLLQVMAPYRRVDIVDA